MKDFSWIKGGAFCHRGLHDNKGIPENSLPSFEKAKGLGLGYEFDVYLTLDGQCRTVNCDCFRPVLRSATRPSKARREFLTNRRSNRDGI